MSEFFGNHSGSFDDKKARISVPAAFRGVLTRLGVEEIILLSSRHATCVEVWSKPDYMAEVESRVAGLSKLSGEYTRIMRKLVGHIHSLRPDAEGRLVLPKELWSKAGLKDEVVFAGRGAFFQIWNRTAFEAEEARLDAEDPGGDV